MQDRIIWLSRWAHNPEISGSNPLPAITGKRQVSRTEKNDLYLEVLYDEVGADCLPDVR